MTTQERLAGWEGEVVPTQSDREMAASIAVLADYQEMILAGRADSSPVVQAFAAYRLAAIEEAANAVEARKAYWGQHPNYTFVAEDALRAIRNLAPPPPPAVVGE